MKQAIILLFLAAAASALPAKEGGYHKLVGIKLAERVRQAEQAADFDGARIVGGVPAPLGIYPYMVGLISTLTGGELSICGGSLLSNTRVLTAAQCWYDGWSQTTEFTVVAGTVTIFYGGVRIQSRDVITHPYYNTINFNHDIALIGTSWITYTNYIQPISLPSGRLLNESFYGVWAQAAGFGVTSDVDSITSNQVLSHVSVQVMSNDECRYYFPANIIDYHICTSGVGGFGPCTSDNSGPLTAYADDHRVLIGVVSFGSVYGCEVDRPTAYSRVSSYVPWIQAYL